MGFGRKSVRIGLVALGLAGGLALGGAAWAAAAGTPHTYAPASTSDDDAGYCGGHGYGMSFGDKDSPMTAVASYLGLTPDQLRDRMRDGQSLGDIAKAQGKSLAGVKEAMVTAMKRILAANPALTDQQRATILKRMQDHLDDMLTSTHMRGGLMYGGHMNGMRGGHGGMMN